LARPDAVDEIKRGKEAFERYFGHAPAGVDGLPDVGEYTTGQLCESLCGHGLMVCRRVEELVLKCQPGCS
jgi:hypothetical protein